MPTEQIAERDLSLWDRSVERMIACRHSLLANLTGVVLIVSPAFPAPFSYVHGSRWLAGTPTPTCAMLAATLWITTRIIRASIRWAVEEHEPTTDCEPVAQTARWWAPVKSNAGSLPASLRMIERVRDDERALWSRVAVVRLRGSVLQQSWRSLTRPRPKPCPTN